MMGPRESVARRLERVIKESGLFGDNVFLTYEGSQATPPLCVYDITSATFNDTTDEPGEYLTEVQVTIVVMHPSGFKALQLMDDLHSAMLEAGIVKRATGLQTVSDDFTPTNVTQRGIRRVLATYDLEVL